MKRLLTSVAAASILASSAFAANTGNHVAVAPNGLGDALIFQEYFAMGQWETHLRVINTDTQRAVVARVAMYEAVDSQEVRDFYIYLSPGDVWTADVKSIAGVPSLVSTDDSTYKGPSPTNGSPTFASVTSPMTVSLATTTGNASVGYINVVAVAALPATNILFGGAAGGGSSWRPGQPISKSAIYTVFQDGQAEWYYPRNDTLSGSEVVKDVTNKRAMNMDAIALKNLLGDTTGLVVQDPVGLDYGNITGRTALTATGAATENTTTDNSGVRETQLNGSFRETAAILGLASFSNAINAATFAGGVANTPNSLAEIDAALSRGPSIIPYLASGDAPAPSVVWINFPTENFLENTTAYTRNVAAGNLNADISYTVLTQIRNESELMVSGVFSPTSNQVLRNEINQVTVADLVANSVNVVPSLAVSDFKAGWISLDLAGDAYSYNGGTPFITTTTTTNAQWNGAIGNTSTSGTTAALPAAGAGVSVTSINPNAAVLGYSVPSAFNTAPALVSFMTATDVDGTINLNWLNTSHYDVTINNATYTYVGNGAAGTGTGTNTQSATRVDGTTISKYEVNK